MNQIQERSTYYQKLYPTINNDDLLEFRLPPNNKANMCLSNVLLRFLIKIPDLEDNSQKLVPENLLGHKQFRSLEVRINGEAITRQNCANEYFLGADFQYLTNFSSDYLITACGYFDLSEFSTAELAESAKHKYKAAVLNSRKGLGKNTFEILMPIDSSIFTSNQNLPTNTPVELSFERAAAKFSLFLSDESEETMPEILALTDAFILVPYTIDDDLINSEKSIVSNPIKIKYEEYSINRFNIPKETANVRLANLLSGPLPSKLFFGIMELDAYTGSFKKSSTRFQVHNVQKATLYVDGNVLSGYPLQIEENAIAVPFVRFQENTNRFMNCYSSRIISMEDFRDFYFLYSAKLDSQTSGSLTFEFDFDEAPTTDLVLVTCSLHEKTMEIDSFRNARII